MSKRFKVKGSPWGYGGAKDVQECTTSEEVMVKAGLNYTVAKAQVMLKMPDTRVALEYQPIELTTESAFYKEGFVYDELPKQYGTFRTDTSFPLGLVGERYEVVQNNKAFEFFDDVIGKDKAIFQRAGSWGHGVRMFVAVKLPDVIKVKGDVTEQYLVFTNAHDGSQSVNILFTPIRIVCQNTLNAAIRTSEASVRFRHTQGVHTKIMTGAEILGITKMQAAKTQDMFEALANIKVTDDEVNAYIANSILSNTEKDNVLTINSVDPTDYLMNRDYYIQMNAGISTRKMNIMADIHEYYHDGPGQHEIEGTAWGLYNAFTGYSANVRNNEGDKRCHDLLYGSSALANAKHLENILYKEEVLFTF